MPSPKPAVSAAVAALAFLGFAASALASPESDRALKDSLPAYDSKAQSADPAQQTPAKATPRPIKRVSDPALRLPEVKIVPGAAPAAPAATPENKEVLVLPKMTVNSARDKTISLPRLFVAPPLKKVEEPLDPNYETPAGRSARLVKKHVSPLFESLNGNKASAAKAAEAEAREQSAKQLNSIADLLELSAALGLDEPAEQKKLKAEYDNLMADRPR